MMPVTRATLSLVPKSSTASSFNEAAKRSTNSLPTAVTRDVGESRIAVVSSPAARATPAATVPLTAAGMRSSGAARARAPRSRPRLDSFPTR